MKPRASNAADWDLIYSNALAAGCDPETAAIIADGATKGADAASLPVTPVDARRVMDCAGLPRSLADEATRHRLSVAAIRDVHLAAVRQPAGPRRLAAARDALQAAAWRRIHAAAYQTTTRMQ